MHETTGDIFSFCDAWDQARAAGAGPDEELGAGIAATFARACRSARPRPDRRPADHPGP